MPSMRETGPEGHYTVNHYMLDISPYFYEPRVKPWVIRNRK